MSTDDALVRAFANLAGLRQNINPDKFNPGESFIAIYEEALGQLEEASGRDLTGFKIKESEVYYPTPREGRPKERAIPASLMASKLDAVLLYARTLVPEEPVRRMGF